MNKSKKSFLIYSFVTALSAALTVIAYIYLKLENDSLSKSKVLLSDQLSAKQNVKVELIVEVNKLESEDRIIKLAEDRLGLVRISEDVKSITVDKARFQRLSEMVKEKHDN